MPSKRIPLRQCIACREQRPKPDLLRVVRTPDGQVLLDERGKAAGRGAYLCAQEECWAKALKKGGLERALDLASSLGTDRRQALLQHARQRFPTLQNEVTHDHT